MILTTINECRVQYNQMILMTLALCFIVILLIIVQSEELQDPPLMKPFIKWKPQVDKVFFYQFDTKNWTYILNDKFLSFSIDSSEIYHGFRSPSLRDKKLIRLVSHLSGGYLRVGGTLGDRILFTPAYRTWPHDYYPVDSGFCGNEGTHCPNITHNSTKIKPISMSAKDWMELNEFCQATGHKLLFGLNVLLRANNSWDSRNAELLLDFSLAQDFRIDWELGNEPNIFPEKFGVSIAPGRLAIDYSILRQLLYRYPVYKDSLLSGPSITNPNKQLALQYLQTFLSSGADVNVVSWHYYTFPPTATLSDFLNPDNYDMLRDAINSVKASIKTSGIPPETPMWIGETGSAYSGGAVNLSDRFVASLLHIDKLGMSAANGVSLVVRQSLYRGVYNLFDPDTFIPHSDFWVSVLFKWLVGKKVLNISEISRDSNHDLNDTIPLRLYAHCSTIPPHPVVYGVNLNNETLGISLHSNNTGHLFSLKGHPDLLSMNVELNGVELKLGSNQELPKMRPITLDLREPVPVRPHSLFFLISYNNLTLCRESAS